MAETRVGSGLAWVTRLGCGAGARRRGAMGGAPTGPGLTRMERTDSDGWLAGSCGACMAASAARLALARPNGPGRLEWWAPLFSAHWQGSDARAKAWTSRSAPSAPSTPSWPASPPPAPRLPHAPHNWPGAELAGIGSAAARPLAHWHWHSGADAMQPMRVPGRCTTRNRTYRFASESVQDAKDESVCLGAQAARIHAGRAGRGGRPCRLCHTVTEQRSLLGHGLTVHPYSTQLFSLDWHQILAGFNIAVFIDFRMPMTNFKRSINQIWWRDDTKEGVLPRKTRKTVPHLFRSRYSLLIWFIR